MTKKDVRHGLKPRDKFVNPLMAVKGPKIKERSPSGKEDNHGRYSIEGLAASKSSR
jgi:hypothetical protein